MSNIISLIADVMLIIFMAFAILLMLGLIFYSIIASYWSEIKYQRSVIRILSGILNNKKMAKAEKLTHAKEQIKQRFQKYTTSNCCWLNIIQLNDRLISDLQDGKLKFENDKMVEYCRFLIDINKEIIDENNYNDEKLMDLLKKTNDIVMKQEIKSLYKCMSAYNEGRLEEKNIMIGKKEDEISRLKKRNKLIVIIDIISIISGIITIVSFLLTL